MRTLPAFRDLLRIGADSSLHAGGQGFESPRLHQAASGGGFRDFPPSKIRRKSRGSPLYEAADAFLLSKRVAGCTEATLGIYAW